MTCDICRQPVYLDEGHVSVVFKDTGTVVAHIACLEKENDD